MVESKIRSTDEASGAETIQFALSEGSFFGEPEQLPCAGVGRRKESVRALVLSHLFMLNNDEFARALQEFPEYKDLLQVCFICCLDCRADYSTKSFQSSVCTLN